MRWSLAPPPPSPVRDLPLRTPSRRPLTIDDDYEIEDLKVTMRGLYHEHASDLSIHLSHLEDDETQTGRAATLVDRRHGDMRYGKP